MKAYLLAAGLGTRLRPVTDSIPKCLLPVGGQPLLGRWLAACRRCGVDEVLINTHHLPDQVEHYVRGAGQEHGVNVQLFHEPRLLGSGGTVLAARDFVVGEESFFIIYADNASDVDLGRMAMFHNDNAAVMTVALFRAVSPERYGIAVLDNAGRIVEFVEKPVRSRSPWANAGIYLARGAVFEYLEAAWRTRTGPEALLDFGFNVLPRLAAENRAVGYCLEELLMDIGTPESYAAARRYFAEHALPIRHGPQAAGPDPAVGDASHG